MSSTVSEEPDYEEAVPGEIDVVANLLSQESGITRTLGREIQQKRQAILFEWLAFLISIVLVVVAGTALSTAKMVVHTVDWLYFWGVVLCTWTLLVALFYKDFRDYRGSQEEGRVACARLERTIRAASQFVEHGRLDFGARLRLEVDLAEAESVVGYWRRVETAFVGETK
jgi:hypothetical protein